MQHCAVMCTVAWVGQSHSSSCKHALPDTQLLSRHQKGSVKPRLCNFMNRTHYLGARCNNKPVSLHQEHHQATLEGTPQESLGQYRGY
jgi:Fe-S-cluster-containing hydrogenase component 2